MPPDLLAAIAADPDAEVAAIVEPSAPGMSLDEDVDSSVFTAFALGIPPDARPILTKWGITTSEDVAGLDEDTRRALEKDEGLSATDVRLWSENARSELESLDADRGFVPPSGFVAKPQKEYVEPSAFERAVPRMPASARSALEAAGVTSLEHLAGLQAADLGNLHNETQIEVSDIAEWSETARAQVEDEDHDAPVIVARVEVDPPAGLVDERRGFQGLVPDNALRPVDKAFFEIPLILQHPAVETESERQLPVNLNVEEVAATMNQVVDGVLLRFSQRRTFVGTTLGNQPESIPLVAGQVRQIVTIDWARRDALRSSDNMEQQESIEAALRRVQAMDEVSALVSEVISHGEVKSNSTSKVEKVAKSKSFLGTVLGIAGGAAGAYFGGPAGGAAGLELGDALGSAIMPGKPGCTKQVNTASVITDLAASQDITGSLSQTINDLTSQSAQATRSRRKTIVREASQSEREQNVAEVVANYNYQHPATTFLYDVEEVHDVETAPAGADLLRFVPFAQPDFRDPAVVHRYRHLLANNALTDRVATSLIDGGRIVIQRPTDLSGLSTQLANRLLELESHSYEVLVRRGSKPAETPRSASWRLGTNVRGTVVFVEPGVSDGLSLIAIEPDGTERVIDEGGWTQHPRYDYGFGLTPMRIVDDGPVWDTEAAVFLRPGVRLEIELTRDFPGDTDLGFSIGTTHGSIPVGYHITDGTPGRRLKLIEVSRQSEQPADVINHLVANNNDHYGPAVLSSLTRTELQILLAGVKDNEGNNLLETVDPQVVATFGNLLGFARIGVPPGEARKILSSWRLRFDGESANERVSVPTGARFAETILGTQNAAEVVDLTRWSQWHEKGPPLQPSAVQNNAVGSRFQQSNLESPDFAPSVAGLQSSPNLPQGQVAGLVGGAVSNNASFLAALGLEQAAQALSTAANSTLEIAKLAPADGPELVAGLEQVKSLAENVVGAARGASKASQQGAQNSSSPSASMAGLGGILSFAKNVAGDDQLAADVIRAITGAVSRDDSASNVTGPVWNASTIEQAMTFLESLGV